MTPRLDYPCKYRDSQGGFALVIALSLMAFVVLLLLSLVTLTQVESRSAQSQLSRLEAEQNALLALQIALSELQRHTGVDQRATSAAGLAAVARDAFETAYRSQAANAPWRTYLGRAPDDRSTVESAYADAINADFQAHWTAVWDSGAIDPTTGTQARLGNPVWLVSGNEQFDHNPGDPAYPAGYWTPNRVLGAGDSVLLVGSGSALSQSEKQDLVRATLGVSLEDSDLSGVNDFVRVPRQAIPDSGTMSKGAFAYWVSDESLKAELGRTDPHEGSGTPAAPLYQLASPQRMGWESLPLLSAVGDAARMNQGDLWGRLLDLPSLALMSDGADATLAQKLPRAYSHDFTPLSVGIHADSYRGGLRKDLTAYFESGAGLNDSEPLADPALYDASDPRFGTNNSGFPGSVNNIPTWGKLRNWWQNSSSFTGFSENTDTAMGLGPVLLDVQYYLGFSIDPVSNHLQAHLAPIVTLWNPHNVTLPNHTYRLELSAEKRINLWTMRVLYPSDGGDVSDSNLFYGEFNDVKWFKARFDGNGRQPNSSGARNPNYATINLKNFLRPLRLDIPTSLAPGESRVFTVDQDWIYSGPDGTVPEMASFYEAIPVGAPRGIQYDTDVEVVFDYARNPAAALRLGGGYPHAWNETDHGPLEWNTRDDFPDILNTNRTFELLRAPSFLYDNNGRLLSQIDKMQSSNETRSWVATNIQSNDPAQRPSPDSVTWLYETPEFFDRFPQSAPAPGQTANREGSYYPMVFHELFSWLTPQRQMVMVNVDDPGTSSAYRGGFHRLFANYNLAASRWTFNPLIEGERARYGNNPVHNNADQFQNNELYLTANHLRQGAPPVPRWGELDFAYDDGSVSRGYILNESIFRGNAHQRIKALPVLDAGGDNRPLLSMGAFARAPLATLFTQPLHPIGNAEAFPYSDREKISGINAREVGGDFGVFERKPNDPDNHMLDLSHLLNDSLWDRYFFSTVPHNTPPVLGNSSPLPNALHRFRPESRPTQAAVRDFDRAAAHIDRRGTFNVNSTSVAAWTALLTSFRDLALQSQEESEANPAGTIPVAGNTNPFERPVTFVEAADDSDPDTYGARSTERDTTRVFAGFRYLDDEQIRELARRIVDEVRLRGPFLSLADFINRRLVVPDGSGNAGSDWNTARTQAIGANRVGVMPGVNSYDAWAGLQGLSAALGRAIQLSGINGGVNHPGHNLSQDRVYGRDPSEITGSGAESANPYILRPELRWFLDSEHTAGAPIGEVGQLFAGTPGFVTQADLLAMLGSALATRGDTFRIRTYGEVANTLSDDSFGVYLEAIVRRLPEFVDPIDPPETELSNLSSTINQRFGRRFEIVALRWLTPDEI